eukprot:Stramenopile-MAST_4_protein_624
MAEEGDALIPGAKAGIDSGDSDRQGGIWEHLHRLPVEGAGVLVGSYNLFSILTVHRIFADEHTTEFTDTNRARLSEAVFFGCVVGQIVFGILGDKIGRSRPFLFTCLFLVGGGLLCSLSPFPFTFTNTPQNKYFVSLFTFFLLGIGIGGEYPLSAAISAENAAAKWRGFQTSLVHSGQGVGHLVSALFGLALISGLKTSQLEAMWRLMFVLGMCAALLILPLRLKMADTSVSLENICNDERHPGAIWVLRQYGSRLFGTGACWFINDIIFYGISVWMAFYLADVQAAGEGRSLRVTLVQGAMIATAALPWYFVSSWYMDKVGHKKMQLYGFFGLGCTSLVMFMLYNHISTGTASFLPWQTLLLGFLNAGPNSTIFVIASEMYPSRIRSTMHGLSAACGKLGAFLGVYIFRSLKMTHGAEYGLVFISICSFVGVLLTWFLIEEWAGKPLKNVDDAYDAARKKWKVETAGAMT